MTSPEKIEIKPGKEWRVIIRRLWLSVTLEINPPFLSTNKKFQLLNKS